MLRARESGGGGYDPDPPDSTATREPAGSEGGAVQHAAGPELEHDERVDDGAEGALAGEVLVEEAAGALGVDEAALAGAAGGQDLLGERAEGAGVERVAGEGEAALGLASEVGVDDLADERAQ